MYYDVAQVLIIGIEFYVEKAICRRDNESNQLGDRNE